MALRWKQEDRGAAHHWALLRQCLCFISSSSILRIHLCVSRSCTPKTTSQRTQALRVHKAAEHCNIEHRRGAMKDAWSYKSCKSSPW